MEKIEQVIVDGWDTSEMSFPRLQEFLEILRQKLTHIRRERNFVQVQCAQMRAAWEMIRLKLEETNSDIRSTAMMRDKLEQKGIEETLKFIKDESKFMAFEHNLLTKNMVDDTAMILDKVNKTWDENILQPLLEQKTALKLQIEEETEVAMKTREEFLEDSGTFLDNYHTQLEQETEKILTKEVEKHEREMVELNLMRESAFFRYQEEYGTLFYEMNKSGKANFSVLRDFFKTVTEDDIIMILILKRELKKILKIVKHKTGMCKKMKRQTHELELTRGKLEVNLRRAKMRMKHYKTWIKSLNRISQLCDIMTDQKNEKTRHLNEKKKKLRLLDQQARDLSQFLEDSCSMLLQRQEEVLKPFRDKLRLLQETAARDQAALEDVIITVDPALREKALAEFRTASKLTESAIRPFVLELSKACKAHDDIIDAVTNNLDYISLPEKSRNKLQKINFDITPYGLSPGGLVTKIP